jgi:hypothetical protein
MKQLRNNFRKKRNFQDETEIQNPTACHIELKLSYLIRVHGRNRTIYEYGKEIIQEFFPPTSDPSPGLCSIICRATYNINSRLPLDRAITPPHPKALLPIVQDIVALPVYRRCHADQKNKRPRPEPCRRKDDPAGRWSRLLLRPHRHRYR